MTYEITLEELEKQLLEQGIDIREFGITIIEASSPNAESSEDFSTN
jgi:hypothetical protein